MEADEVKSQLGRDFGSISYVRKHMDSLEKKSFVFLCDFGGCN